MTSLDAWPEHRRELLLWRYALVLDYYGVEDLVADLANEPCRAATLIPLARGRHTDQKPERSAR